MCLIIDANVAHHFKDASNIDAKTVREWVEKKSGRLTVGGRNYKELADVGWMRVWLYKLNQAGLTRHVADETIDTEERALVEAKSCISDDPHVIALARKSGARILYSHDKPLHSDFLNKALVDKPRGGIYQNATHAHLLSDRNCGQPL